MSDAPKCPLREDCDLTAAYMAGHERGRDDLRNRIAALEDEITRLRAEIEMLIREAELQAQEIDRTRARADKWQGMVLDCEEYLKDGETPRQRMDRDQADVLGLMKLLQREKERVAIALAAGGETVRAALAQHGGHERRDRNE